MPTEEGLDANMEFEMHFGGFGAFNDEPHLGAGRGIMPNTGRKLPKFTGRKMGTIGKDPKTGEITIVRNSDSEKE